MRTILLTLMFTAAAAVAQNTTNPATPRQQADQHFAQGVAAEKAGDPTAAREAYTQALRLNPQHTRARYHLNQLRTTAPAVAARGRETRIGEVMIPEIDLDAATLRETIDLLGKLVERESEGKVTPNFVIQDPSGKIAETEITLKLKNVPAKAILDYVTREANARIRYDEHAVVIHPR